MDAINSVQPTTLQPHYSKRKRIVMPIAIVTIVVATVVVILIGVGVIVPGVSQQVPQPNDTLPPTSNNDGESPTKTQPILQIGGYELLQQVPHDSSAFTQGLLTVERADGQRLFYESTGQYGESDLRLVEIETGTVLASYPIAKNYFGEGIAHYPIDDEDNDHSFGIIQLTWNEQTAMEYKFLTGLTDPAVTSWPFETTNREGWGITYNPIEKHFYVTDGTIYLHVWDATTRQQIAKYPVSFLRQGESTSRTINYLNELEWDPVTRTVLANVLLQDQILRIDPQTGFVLTVYDLSTLYPRNTRTPPADVLNGIALTYDVLNKKNGNNNTAEDTDQVWVTGKWWPSMYRIRLVDPSP